MSMVRLRMKDAKGETVTITVDRTAKSMTPPRGRVNRSQENARRRRQMERDAKKREAKEASQ